MVGSEGCCKLGPGDLISSGLHGQKCCPPRGAAASWWATFLAMQPAGYQVPWTEFAAAFRAHHIPSSRTSTTFTTSLRTTGPRWGLSCAIVRYVCERYLRSFILLIIFFTTL